jgi:guanine deaminase
MTLFRGTVLDCPVSPFEGGELRADEDGGLLVRDGRIEDRGAFATLAARHPHEPVTDVRGGLLVPGFVDTHVHFPQVRIIGGLGMPLLDWLDRRALPEEARLSDDGYAAGVARDFVSCLLGAGTTSALVFGSHFPGAVDLLFRECERVGLRVTSGLVVSDEILRADLLCTPAAAADAALRLAATWQGRGLARYAVTPRFSLSCSEAMLESCAGVLESTPGAFVTSHVNENLAEIAQVRARHPGSYVDSYDRYGLLGRHTVLAHNVHPTDDELRMLADRGASVAHCASSNGALGSGAFPMRRHLDHGVRFALGTDIGAGTTFSLLREGLQAYLVQRVLGGDGVTLGAADMLYLATRAGALALDLPEVGDFSVGRRFDAVWLRPLAGSALDLGLRYAADPLDALGRAFAQGDVSDVAAVWVDGRQIVARDAALGIC